MITMKVLHNGKLITRAGRADLCVLAANITAVGVLGPASAGANKKDEGNDLHLYVGGMTSKKDGQKDEHLTWTGHIDLGIGDEISVKIIESTEIDQPIREGEPVDEVAKEKTKRELWESAKHFYLEHRAEYETDVE